MFINQCIFCFVFFCLDFTDVIKDVANIDKAVLCCQVNLRPYFNV